MNIVDLIDNILDEHSIYLNKHVPFKFLLLNSAETQDKFGLTRSLSIYCPSNNHSMMFIFNYRHDFYYISDISFKISKTFPGTTKTETFENKFEGNNEFVESWYNKIKQKYYDPHLNTKVLVKI